MITIFEWSDIIRIYDGEQIIYEIDNFPNCDITFMSNCANIHRDGVCVARLSGNINYLDCDNGRSKIIEYGCTEG